MLAGAPENKFWQAPRVWTGETVVIAACGPSLTQEQIDYVRGKARVIAVNDAYRFAPWADVLYSADYKWWKHHFAKLDGVSSIFVTAQHDPQPVSPRVNLIGYDCDGQKSSFENRGFVRGSNSGAEAMHLGYLMGPPERILLLGCDCTSQGSKTHFFGKHPPGLEVGSDYNAFRHSFEVIGREIMKRGVPVINCSPVSTLTCFQKANLEDVI